MTCWHLIILKTLLNKRNCTMLYSSPRAALAKYHKLGGWTQIGSRCWITCSLTPRRGNTSCLFLASGGWPATSSIPRLQVYHSGPLWSRDILPVCLIVILPVYLFLCSDFPLYIPVKFDQGRILMASFKLNILWKDPTSS